MITILCAGSRGDFQPYIALAQRLIKAGKKVRIAGSKSFEAFITAYGIDFFPISADMKTLNIDPKVIEAAGSADNPLKMLLAFNKMKAYGTYTTGEYYEACKNSELIIYHPGCAIGYFASKQLGIPAVLASPFPMHKTKSYLSVVMYGKSKPTVLNKIISYHMIQGMLWLASKESIKAFWKIQFGHPPKDFRAPFEKHNNPGNPALISCSNHIFERPSDWNPNIYQDGYWIAEETEAYIPPKELVDFIQKGEKPIYIGFGSMSMIKHHDPLGPIVVEALIKSGKRGIISGFGQPANLPDTVFALDSIPHTWLFEHVSAVCHHGGAGTSAAGFAAGVPSIIIPFSNDQFAWAHRAYDLGIGVKPIYSKNLNSDNLASAIKAAHHPEIVKKSASIGEMIRQEKGPETCAQVILKLCPSPIK